MEILSISYSYITPYTRSLPAKTSLAPHHHHHHRGSQEKGPVRENFCGYWVLGGWPDVASSDPRVWTALRTGTGECSIRFTGKCQVRHPSRAPSLPLPQWAQLRGLRKGGTEKGTCLLREFFCTHPGSVLSGSYNRHMKYPPISSLFLGAEGGNNDQALSPVSFEGIGHP